MTQCRSTEVSLHPTYLLSYLLACLLTPWSRVFLEKLTGPQVVKKFPSFHGTPKVHYRVYKCPPPLPILSQINPIHVPRLYKFPPSRVQPETRHRLSSCQTCGVLYDLSLLRQANSAKHGGIRNCTRTFGCYGYLIPRTAES